MNNKLKSDCSEFSTGEKGDKVIQKLICVARARWVAWGDWWDYSINVDHSYERSTLHLSVAFSEAAGYADKNFSLLKPWTWLLWPMSLFCSWRSKTVRRKYDWLTDR